MLKLTFLLLFIPNILKCSSVYFHLINKAELAICNGDIERAAIKYEEARNIHKLFTRDLFNYWIVEVKLGNIEV